MSINIHNAIYATLTGSAALTATLIGTRIYAIEGPHNSTVPYLVLSPTSGILLDSFYGTIDTKIYPFQIDLFALRTTGLTALDAANAVLYTLLHKSRITVTGHDGAVITCENAGVYFADQDAVRIMSEWRAESTQFS